jgi:hypothetical protein
MPKNLTVSRRKFLEVSAGALAGAALMSMPRMSFALPGSLQSVDWINCPTDPLKTAESSSLVKNSYDKILSFINKIQDNSLRQKTYDIINNPAPTVMNEYTSEHTIRLTYNELISQKLVDPEKIQWNTLFPDCTNPQKSPQAFISAPGSSYDSHHSYPGGLAVHTAINLSIASGIYNIYDDVFRYKMDYDAILAAEALHDIAKPWVFQWLNDGTSLPEFQIAGTGAHHILSLAETIYRGFPTHVIVAQACAHNHPGTKADEAEVARWLMAAAIIARKNPIRQKLLNEDGLTLNGANRQEGYIVHLGDHDFILSVPAAQRSVHALQKIARNTYGLSKDDSNGQPFHKFRNYIGAQAGFMRVDNCIATDPSLEKLTELVKEIIQIK